MSITIRNDKNRPLTILGVTVNPGCTLSGIPTHLEDAARRIGFTIITRSGDIQPPKPPETSTQQPPYSVKPLQAGLEMPTISVVIPTRFNEVRVQELLASLGTYPSLEIILVQTGGVPNDWRALAERAASWTSRDRRIITVFCNEHLGIGSTRNMGFMLASAPWTVMMDADDTLCPGAIDTILTAITQHPADVYYGHYYRDGQLHKAPQWKPQALEKYGCFILGCRCVRTSLLQAVRCGEDYPYAEDLELMIALEHLGARFQRIDAPLTIIRSHGQNTTRNKTSEVGYHARRARQAYQH